MIANVAECMQMCYTFCMKLSQYAKQQGISYSTALRWFHDGVIKGYQVPQAPSLSRRRSRNHQPKSGLRSMHESLLQNIERISNGKPNASCSIVRRAAIKWRRW